MALNINKSKFKPAKHLIIISYDAFCQENWEVAASLPNMAKLVERGAYSTKLRSVYPTLTYTAHTTLITGVYPDKHGIVHNNPVQPFVAEKEQSWYWYRKEIKTATLYDAVKEHHMNAAGILWPVTGKASIKYNMPEIAAINKENQAIKVLRNGNPLFCIGMELKYGRVRKGIEEPYLDEYTTLCAIDTIKHKKPNLLLMHLIELDDSKHNYGTDSVQVEQSIHRMDLRLGRIMDAVKQAGIAEDTVIMVVGDHGQFNVKRKVHLNNLLRDAGLIVQKEGAIKWRAYLQSSGGSAYLISRQDDPEAEIIALSILEDALKEEKYGIEKIYSRAELDKLHADKAVNYVVEAKIGTSFEDSLQGSTIVDLEAQGIKYATHGYSPDKENYRCALIVSGTGIKNGYRINDVEMVDIAPTSARILGFDYYNCDGKALMEIFAQDKEMNAIENIDYNRVV